MAPYIVPMNIRFPRARLAAVQLAAAMLAATPALAVDIPIPGASTPSAAELQILRSIQSRQEFQLEQRINREIDRLSIQQPSPRLDVPVVKPTCREDVNGQKMLRACR